MPLGQYHYSGLIEAMHEIRDEIRALNEKLTVLTTTPQVILNGSELNKVDMERAAFELRKAWERNG